MADFINTLPSQPVTLERLDENAVMRIKSGQSKANINGADEKLFPPAPEVEQDNVAVITAEEFRKAVGRVAYCAATENGRPVLTGVLMDLDGDTLITVAGDGFRMGMQRTTLETPAERKVQAIVPARTVLEV